MVHEVLDKDKFFAAMKNILSESGEFLIVEPKFFHVSKKEFGSTIGKAEASDLEFAIGSKITFIFHHITNA